MCAVQWGPYIWKRRGPSGARVFVTPWSLFCPGHCSNGIQDLTVIFSAQSNWVTSVFIGKLGALSNYDQKTKECGRGNRAGTKQEPAKSNA